MKPGRPARGHASPSGASSHRGRGPALALPPALAANPSATLQGRRDPPKGRPNGRLLPLRRLAPREDVTPQRVG